MTSYMFYATDGSFDYNSPFGTSTYHCFDEHGIIFDIDTMDISTLDGYGEFSDVKDCKTHQDLLNYVKDNLHLVNSTGDDLEVFEELIEALEEYITLNKCA